MKTQTSIFARFLRALALQVVARGGDPSPTFMLGTALGSARYPTLAEVGAKNEGLIVYAAGFEHGFEEALGRVLTVASLETGPEILRLALGNMGSGRVADPLEAIERAAVSYAEPLPANPSGE